MGSHLANAADADVVVIGSGIGGLSAAGMLARYGYRVLVLEAHTVAGGAAHSFELEGFHFDSGPSFFSGLAMEDSFNPVTQVLDLLGEGLQTSQYSGWTMHMPEGEFACVSDAAGYRAELERFAGREGVAQWDRLLARLAPLAAGIEAMPVLNLRSDAAAALTLAPHLLSIAKAGPGARELSKPFSALVDPIVTHPFVRKLIDLECFMLSGLPASGTPTAEMAFMFHLRERAPIDYPIGGSQAIVDALVRGISKYGGRVETGAMVEGIWMEDGRAVGVDVRRVGRVRARKAVISNASVWDTASLVPAGSGAAVQTTADETPACDSFMHLHVGFGAEGLQSPGIHHIVIHDWDDITAPQNVVAVSIPSVMDPGLAPAGTHAAHVYTPATEPFALWEGLKRGTPEYAALKEERSQILWKGLQRVIPDIRERARVTRVGTPLTHKRFLRRHRGGYGAEVRAGQDAWPSVRTEIPGLYRCGDSVMPGIGVPAAAGSGIVCANTVVPAVEHLALLQELQGRAGLSKWLGVAAGWLR